MTATESTLTVRTARAGLLILTLINLFNYLDRWIVAALAESMKHSELHLSDTQLGALMTGFLIVYMLAAPLFGWLGATPDCSPPARQWGSGRPRMERSRRRCSPTTSPASNVGECSRCSLPQSPLARPSGTSSAGWSTTISDGVRRSSSRECRGWCWHSWRCGSTTHREAARTRPRKCRTALAAPTTP